MRTVATRSDGRAALETDDGHEGDSEVVTEPAA